MQKPLQVLKTQAGTKINLLIYELAQSIAFTDIQVCWLTEIPTIIFFVFVVLNESYRRMSCMVRCSLSIRIFRESENQICILNTPLDQVLYNQGYQYNYHYLNNTNSFINQQELNGIPKQINQQWQKWWRKAKLPVWCSSAWLWLEGCRNLDAAHSSSIWTASEAFKKKKNYKWPEVQWRNSTIDVCR